MGVRLELETRAARAVGAVSRATGRGGGTTLPGKLLWKLDRSSLGALAAQLTQGIVLISGTNGKTTTTAMVARIVGDRARVVWNNSGANLASGVTSTLLSTRGAELGLLEVDEFALPEIMRRTRPRIVLLGNLFRDQLDRYGELEHIAERWRAAVKLLPADTTLVVNADDPLVSSLADGYAHTLRYGLDDVSSARTALQHAADSKYCVTCGTPYRYAAAYVGHLGEYSCPSCGQARPPLDLSASTIDLEGLDASSFLLRTPSGARRMRVPLPGLYNVYNAVAAASVSHALGIPPETVAAALEGFSGAFGRFERIVANGRELVLLLIKNPAGANEAIRTLDEGGVPATILVALNDAIADGRDVSWIWDVDFEPLLARARTIVVSGERAAELALRFVYAGYPRSRLEIVAALEPALDRVLEVAGEGDRVAVLPTYTAMLKLRAIATARGLVRPYWERS